MYKIKIELVGKNAIGRINLVYSKQQQNLSIDDKFKILLSALSSLLKRDLPVTPNENNINLIIKALDIKFGPTNNDQILKSVEKLS